MLQPNRKTATRKGDCEASHFDGKGVGVDLTLSHGNIWLCDECYVIEQDTIRLSTKVVENSKEIDARIEISTDIYNAVTVPFTTLSDAVNRNPEIPAERKKIAIADLVSERVDHFSGVIFDLRKSLKQAENERLAWQQNLQSVVGGLHEKQQEKYRKYRVDYKPQPAPKPTKSRGEKPASIAVAYSKKALTEAAEKYGVPASTVRGLQLSNKGWTFEEAARQLAIMMGLIKK